MVHKPHDKQALFLLNDDRREVLYGGAAGGGKTDALLMAALEYVEEPGYAALILMKSFADLALPSAAMSRTREWLSGTAARPADGGRSWHFPSGASLTFGYLDNAGDEQRYRTAEFQFVAFDELTRFKEEQYRFLFSRLRRLAGSDVPLRMRSATNPGGVGHEWVKKRFVPDEYHRVRGDERFGRTWEKGPRLFVPASRRDNPSLDQELYGEFLAELLPIERARLDDGDWQAHAEGHFKQHWFRRYRDMVDAWHLMPGCRPALKCRSQVVIAVDPAGGVSESADYTAMVVGAVTEDYDVLILDVLRERIPVEGIVEALRRLCQLWRPDFVVIEDEFAQSQYIRVARQTPGIPTVHAVSTGGKSKLVRATPAILRAEQGGIYLPEEAHWLDDFTSELCSFTGDDKLDAHDDQCDAAAHLINSVDRFRLGGGDDAPGGRGRRGG